MLEQDGTPAQAICRQESAGWCLSTRLRAGGRVQARSRCARTGYQRLPPGFTIGIRSGPTGAGSFHRRLVAVSAASVRRALPLPDEAPVALNSCGLIVVVRRGNWTTNCALPSCSTAADRRGRTRVSGWCRNRRARAQVSGYNAVTGNRRHRARMHRSMLRALLSIRIFLLPQGEGQDEDIKINTLILIRSHTHPEGERAMVPLSKSPLGEGRCSPLPLVGGWGEGF